MTRRSRLVSVLGLGLGLALVAAPACKKSDDATQAAKEAREKASELRGEVEDKTDRAAESLDELGKKADETLSAEAKYERERDAHVAALKGRLMVEAINTNMVKLLADAQPLTDAGREQVNEKGTTLAMRVNEAANFIDQLQQVGAEQWEPQHKAAQDLLKQIEQARNDAFATVREAPRVQPPAAS